jgi:hypothetical protein
MASNDVVRTDYKHAEQLPKRNQDPQHHLGSLAPLSHYHTGKEILHGGHGVGIIDEGGVVAERVHGEEHEIERGEGFWPAKLKIKPHRFGFALKHANPSADQRVGLWGLVGVVISVTAHCIGKIVQEAGFGLQNRKLNRVGLDLVWNMQIQAQIKGWVWGLVGVVIFVTVHCVGEIACRASFGLQN